MNPLLVGKAESQGSHLDACFAGAPVGMVVLDDQFRFVRVNDVMAKINGPPAEDHIGKSARDEPRGFDNHVGTPTSVHAQPHLHFDSGGVFRRM